LAPLNNWSEELIKLKVAAYPHRVYYGQIDRTKINEVYLDLYKLYDTTDASAMEEKAIDFTKRLVGERLEHHAKCGLEQFAEAEDNSLWRNLFYASMGNPRTLGDVLYYLYKSHLIHKKKINIKAIRDAAAEFYGDKFQSGFMLGKFVARSFDERASIFSLKELLESLVRHARELKSHSEFAMMRGLNGTPPTSHFYVSRGLESILATLELNFFLTKYFEMSDIGGRKVAVYALNFGICQQYAIAFGWPMKEREDSLYFDQRIFDFDPLLVQFIQQNQEIRCTNCGIQHGSEQLNALSLFDMRCPTCKTGTCVVRNLSRKYESLLNDVNTELLLPPTELGILQTLKAGKRAMHARDIATDLDMPPQLMGETGETLAEQGLVKRGADDQGRTTFEITELAQTRYFSSAPGDSLDVG